MPEFVVSLPIPERWDPKAPGADGSELALLAL